jgi:hypothetical protein
MNSRNLYRRLKRLEQVTPKGENVSIAAILRERMRADCGVNRTAEQALKAFPDERGKSIAEIIGERRRRSLLAEEANARPLQDHGRETISDAAEQ